MPSFDPLDAPHEGPALRVRLLVAAGAIALGCTLALPGLPSAGPTAVAAPIADASATAANPHPALLVRAARPASRTAAVPFGFDAMAVGDFDDLTLAIAVGASAPALVVREGVEGRDRAGDQAGGQVVAEPVAESVNDPADEPFIVMIDPGHGGSDPGAIAPNGLQEKELTADIAERTRRFLSEVDGIEVRLTREGTRACRARDGSIASATAAPISWCRCTSTTCRRRTSRWSSRSTRRPRTSRKAAPFVAPRAGIELVQMSAPDLAFTEGSARLAKLMQRRVYGEVVHENPEATDAGVKRDTLFVLTRSLVPGALIELTCLSNPGEAERLEGSAYRDRLAAALADAVRDYRSSLEARPLGSLDTWKVSTDRARPAAPRRGRRAQHDVRARAPTALDHPLRAREPLGDNGSSQPSPAACRRCRTCPRLPTLRPRAVPCTPSAPWSGSAWPTSRSPPTCPISRAARSSSSPRTPTRRCSSSTRRAARPSVGSTTRWRSSPSG